MLYSGEYVDAETAGHWGLVNRVVPGEKLQQEVRAYAESIADGAPPQRRPEPLPERGSRRGRTCVPREARASVARTMTAQRPRAGASDDEHSGLEALFKPQSVAIIGASSSPEKPSHMPLRNLLNNKFPGKVFPINPSTGEILGVATFGSIADVPARVDLAYIVIPAGSVLAELQRCAEAGVTCAIVAASGFAEADSPEGRIRQQRIAELAVRTGMRILGPNTNGVYNTESGLSLGYNAGHERRMAPGPLSIVSHSGALFNAFAGQMEARNVGLSAFVAVGNEADVTMLDVVEHCVHRTDATIIAMVMESVRDGHRLREISAAARASGKQLLALKLGRSEVGVQATVAHSSRLAGSGAAYDAWLTDAGVPVLRTIDAVVAMAAILENSTAEVGNGGLGIVTFSGGAGAMIADIADDLSIPIADLAPTTLAGLESHLARSGQLLNPVDLGAGIPMDKTYTALRAVSTDPGVGATVVFLHSMQTPEANALIAESIVTAQRDTGVLHTVLAPGGVSSHEADVFRRAGIAVFAETMTCMSTLKALLQVAASAGGIRNDLPTVETLPPGSLGELESLELVTRFDVPVVTARLVSTAAEAVALAEDLGGPVVLKGLVADVAHKAAAGLVRMRLTTSQDVSAAFDSLRERMAHLSHGDHEIVLEPVIEAEFEAFVGCNREPGIGYFLIAGLGGVHAEAMQQTVLWSLPVERAVLKSRLSMSALGRMLASLEHEAPGTAEEFVDLLERVQNLILTHRDSIEALDLNPVLIGRNGPIAVDALLIGSGANC